MQQNNGKVNAPDWLYGINSHFMIYRTITNATSHDFSLISCLRSNINNSEMLIIFAYFIFISFIIKHSQNYK